MLDCNVHVFPCPWLRKENTEQVGTPSNGLWVGGRAQKRARQTVRSPVYLCPFLLSAKRTSKELRQFPHIPVPQIKTPGQGTPAMQSTRMSQEYLSSIHKAVMPDKVVPTMGTHATPKLLKTIVYRNKVRKKHRPQLRHWPRNSFKSSIRQLPSGPKENPTKVCVPQRPIVSKGKAQNPFEVHRCLWSSCLQNSTCFVRESCL